MEGTNVQKHLDQVQTFLKAASPQIGEEMGQKIPKSLPLTTSAPGPVPMRTAYPATAAGTTQFDTAVAKHDGGIAAFNSSAKHRTDKADAYARATEALVQTLTPAFFEQLKAQCPAAENAWRNNDPLTFQSATYEFVERNSSGGSVYTRLFKSIRSINKILNTPDSTVRRNRRGR